VFVDPSVVELALHGLVEAHLLRLKPGEDKCRFLNYLAEYEVLHLGMKFHAWIGSFVGAWVGNFVSGFEVLHLGRKFRSWIVSFVHRCDISNRGMKFHIWV
jgi:hypothetical protein